MAATLNEKGVRMVTDQWDSEPWREPDEESEGTYAAWYGPGDDPESCVTVEKNGTGWDVAEYKDTTGLIEDVGEQERFLVVTTHVDGKDVENVLTAAGKEDVIDDLLDEDDFWIEDVELLRWVAGVGVAKIAYFGGAETFAGELP